MTRSKLQSQRTANMQASLIRTLHDRKRPQSLNLGLGQPSLSVDPQILEGGLQRLKAGSMGYTANAGMPKLRELIAQHHALADRTGADNVIVTCGAQEAIFAVMAACLDAGDEVIIPDPGFPSYASVATLLGAQCVYVTRSAAQGFRLCSDDVIAAITPKTRLIILNSPSNPGGSVDEEIELKKLAAAVEDAGIAVLSDEIYADLCYLDGGVASIAHHTNNAYVVSGLSKNCAMTGFRLGYVIGAQIHMLGVLRAHHMASTCAAVLSQHMAQIAFEQPALLRAHLPIYQVRRERALAALRQYVKAPFVTPDGAFYILLDVTAYSRDSLSLALELLEKEDVVTAPGEAFGEATRGWLRLTFADEPEVFTEAAQRIGRFLAGRNH